MNIDLIEPSTTAISEYSQTEAALTELRERMANVEYDVTTVKGMAVAKADRAEVRGLRTGLEAMRKQIKAPALAHCKLIDAEAARITVELLKLEEPIDHQIKAREAALEAEKAARELAERQRITTIHERIASVRNYHAMALECRTADRVQSLIDRARDVWAAYNFEADFQEFGGEAQTAYDETNNRMIEIHAQKFADEAERAAVKAAQVAEAARLTAEREALATQRAEQEAQAAAYAKTIEVAAAEIARQKAQQDKEDAERRAAFDKEVKALADAKAAHAETLRATKDAEDLAAYQAATTVDAETVRPVIDAELPAVVAEQPPTYPTDADVIYSAAYAVSREHDMTMAQAIDRLAAINDWKV